MTAPASDPVAPAVLGIDPGTTRSAWVLLGVAGVPRAHAIEDNAVLLRRLSEGWFLSFGRHDTVIEMVSSYGMRYIGAEVYETCVWVGRFIQAAWPEDVHRLTRPAVKAHVLGSVKGKDSDVLAALKDRFGGESAKGTKKAPGPLYGIHGDVWAALAVAVAYQDGVR